MTLKSSFTEYVVGLQIIHEARRMLWDRLVECTRMGAPH